MFLTTCIVTAALAAVLAFSAVRKLSHRPEVVEQYRRAGVPEDRLGLLAGTLLAGATALVLGLAWAPLGIAAAVALAVYFAVAVGFHVRAHDVAHAPTPAVLACLAVAAAVLRSATA